jgi:ammonia channel protein AmtB
MCFSRKAWKSVRFSLLVGVVATSVVLQPFLCQLAMAARGPCTQDQPGQFSNTIRCENGACAGMVQITPMQSTCKSTDEGPCTDGPYPIYVTYQWKSQDQGWQAFVSCIGGSVACQVCVAAAATLCYYVPNPWTCIASPIVCGLLCLITPDWCCYNTCITDPDTRFEVPGGHRC